jgi:hypothetical protein
MWILVTTLLLLPLSPAFSQEAVVAGAVRLFREAQGPYSLVEKSDWSRYDNGKYIGHVYREVRSSIIPQGTVYRGNFFVLEETLRDMRQSARAVDEVIPVSFRIEGERGLSLIRQGMTGVSRRSGIFRPFPRRRSPPAQNGPPRENGRWTP